MLVVIVSQVIPLIKTTRGQPVVPFHRLVLPTWKIPLKTPFSTGSQCPLLSRAQITNRGPGTRFSAKKQAGCKEVMDLRHSIGPALCREDQKAAQHVSLDLRAPQKWFTYQNLQHAVRKTTGVLSTRPAQGISLKNHKTKSQCQCQCQRVISSRQRYPDPMLAFLNVQ